MIGIVRVVRDGARDTMAKIVDTIETLNTFIRSRNISEDRELDRVLMQMEAGLSAWMQTAGSRETVPVQMLPDGLDILHLKEKLYDPASDVPLDPLEDGAEEDRPESMSLDELRRYGGPHLDALRGALDEVAASDGEWTIGVDLFPRLAADERRPVDALGLLHLIADREDLVRTGTHEAYVTRRPDGTEQVLLLPQITRTRRLDDDQ